MPYCRALGLGLWEVRSDLTGSRIARVIFSIIEGEMLLLHGFVKKTRKTPSQDIDLALNANERWSDETGWQERAGRPRRNF